MKLLTLLLILIAYNVTATNCKSNLTTKKEYQFTTEFDLDKHVVDCNLSKLKFKNRLDSIIDVHEARKLERAIINRSGLNKAINYGEK